MSSEPDTVRSMDEKVSPVAHGHANDSRSSHRSMRSFGATSTHSDRDHGYVSSSQASCDSTLADRRATEATETVAHETTLPKAEVMGLYTLNDGPTGAAPDFHPFSRASLAETDHEDAHEGVALATLSPFQQRRRKKSSGDTHGSVVTNSLPSNSSAIQSNNTPYRATKGVDVSTPSIHAAEDGVTTTSFHSEVCASSPLFTSNVNAVVNATQDPRGDSISELPAALDTERGLALLARLYIQRRDAFLSGLYPCVRATAVKLAAYQLSIECGAAAPQGRVDMRSVLPLRWTRERGIDKDVLEVKNTLGPVR